ncbi:MAG: D-sedoheptulose 7-phosphate isomerase [Nitrospinae bacterium]|nr:D-sedoheptulose 7-phosphate isomerase [Nitrospinota bacterium]
MKKTIEECFTNHINLAKRCAEEFQNDIESIANTILVAIKNGNKIVFMGNGGSAADSQHLAAEFVGRFKLERKPLPAIAFTTDSSILTAVGNDYGYDQLFLRQTEALAVKGDIIIGISTSGNSQNIALALDEGNKKGCKTIALLGKDGGTIKDIAQQSIVIPSNDTARIQEMHIFIGHTLCELVENNL